VRLAIQILAAISTVTLACALGPASSEAANDACPATDGGLPISRTIEIDATNGPLFGSVTRQAKEPSFLEPKEVVLTFDDGPMPWVTKSVLSTLDAYCTKATFFSVGDMALSYPAMVRDVLARGHTLGSHTFTHPYNLPRKPLAKAKDEIERGLAAVSTAAGQPIAPFFRFPALADSASLLTYLGTRHIAAFSVDIVSNDSYIHDTQRLVDRTLSEVERLKGGIILFHDIKTTTAKALPQILAGLKARGYSVVHLTAKAPAVPDPALMAEYAPKMAKLAPGGDSGAKVLLPLNGAPGPERAEHDHDAPINLTTLSPAARDRSEPVKSQNVGSNTPRLTQSAASGHSTGMKILGWSQRSEAHASPPHVLTRSGQEDIFRGGWMTEVKQGKAARSAKSSGF
jgi:peptidoglycan/xylan/chitin deacetylase (PgdA/CDA1 family)